MASASKSPPSVASAKDAKTASDIIKTKSLTGQDPSRTSSGIKPREPSRTSAVPPTENVRTASGIKTKEPSKTSATSPLENVKSTPSGTRALTSSSSKGVVGGATAQPIDSLKSAVKSAPSASLKGGAIPEPVKSTSSGVKTTVNSKTPAAKVVHLPDPDEEATKRRLTSVHVSTTPRHVTPKYDPVKAALESEFHINPKALTAKCSKRLSLMSKPVRPQKKYDSSKAEESIVSTAALKAKCGRRTKILALPRKALIASNLLSLKEYGALIQALKIQQKLLKKSEYSRLAHECESAKIARCAAQRSADPYAQYRKYDRRSLKKRLKELYEWCEENSKPRAPSTVTGVVARRRQTRRTYESVLRMLKLAEPLERRLPKCESESKNLDVSQHALRYTASARIERLALPRPYYVQDLRNPDEISAKALKYKASARIASMSQPNVRSTSSDKEDPYSISPRALSATASPRLVELSQPRSRPNPDQFGDDPYQVKPLALSAKCSKRLDCLSKPRLIYDRDADFAKCECFDNSKRRRSRSWQEGDGNEPWQDCMSHKMTVKECVPHPDCTTRPYLGYPILERYDVVQERKRKEEIRRLRNRQRQERMLQEEEAKQRLARCEALKLQQYINKLILTNKQPKCYGSDLEEGEIRDTGDETEEEDEDKGMKKRLQKARVHPNEKRIKTAHDEELEREYEEEMKRAEQNQRNKIGKNGRDTQQKRQRPELKGGPSLKKLAKPPGQSGQTTQRNGAGESSQHEKQSGQRGPRSQEIGHSESSSYKKRPAQSGQRNQNKGQRAPSELEPRSGQRRQQKGSRTQPRQKRRSGEITQRIPRSGESVSRGQGKRQGAQSQRGEHSSERGQLKGQRALPNMQTRSGQVVQSGQKRRQRAKPEMQARSGQSSQRSQMKRQWESTSDQEEHPGRSDQKKGRMQPGIQSTAKSQMKKQWESSSDSEGRSGRSGQRKVHNAQPDMQERSGQSSQRSQQKRHWESSSGSEGRSGRSGERKVQTTQQDSQGRSGQSSQRSQQKRQWEQEEPYGQGKHKSQKIDPDEQLRMYVTKVYPGGKEKYDEIEALEIEEEERRERKQRRKEERRRKDEQLGHGRTELLRVETAPRHDAKKFTLVVKECDRNFRQGIATKTRSDQKTNKKQEKLLCIAPYPGHRSPLPMPPCSGKPKPAPECLVPYQGHRSPQPECIVPYTDHRTHQSDCIPPRPGHRTQHLAVSDYIAAYPRYRNQDTDCISPYHRRRNQESDCIVPHPRQPDCLVPYPGHRNEKSRGTEKSRSQR